MIRIVNAGRDIVETDYWASAPAQRGLCYLSGNAGAWRLLVPPAAEYMLPEMRTGTSATVEPSMHLAGHWDVVFEDGSSTPFSLALAPEMIDRVIGAGDCRLMVWTVAGKVVDLACVARSHS